MADRAQWTPEETLLYIELCLEQVRLGKRGSGHLQHPTLREVGIKFQEQRGRTLTPKQLRNKWDSLRKQWVKWNWLKCYAKSGVGWNEVIDTFDAPDEWWSSAEEEYKKSHKDGILCFRTQGLKYRESLEEMFKGTKGTNHRLWAPSSSAPPPADSLEGSGDSDEDPRFVDPQDNVQSLGDDLNEDSSFPTSIQDDEPSGKRKTPGSSVTGQGRKKRYSREDLTNSLGDLLANMKARSGSNSGSVSSGPAPNSMQAVMQEVWKLPVVVENGRLGLDATDVFMDPTKREAFVSCPTLELKTRFILREIERNLRNQP